MVCRLPAVVQAVSLVWQRLQLRAAGQVTGAVQSTWRAAAAGEAPAEARAAGREGCAVAAQGGSGSRSRPPALLEQASACHEAC